MRFSAQMNGLAFPMSMQNYLLTEELAEYINARFGRLVDLLLERSKFFYTDTFFFLQ